MVTKVSSGRADRDGAARQQGGQYVSSRINPPPEGVGDISVVEGFH